MPGDKFLELADSPDRHVLDVLFGDAREAVTIQDRGGRLVFANDPAARMLGLRSGKELVDAPLESIVSRYEMLDETGKPLSLDRLPGRRVLAGQDAPEITVGYRERGSSHVLWSRVNASPVRNDAGEIVWAINFFLDITAQVRQRDRERILQAVSETLAESLWKGPSLKALSGIIVPEVASWCGFHLVDDFGYLATDAIAYPDTSEARALVGMVDSMPIDPNSDRKQARVLASGEIVSIEDITEEMLATLEDERGERIADQIRLLDIGSVYCLPLGVRGNRFGTMTLLRSRTEGPFDPGEMALVREIADRAGTALANIRLFEREHHTAEALRRGLTPDSLPRVDRLAIAARYLPLARAGHVGGDFYDVFDRGDGQIAMVIGDIEGKGIEAAAAVGMVRQTLKTVLALQPSIDSVMAHLNGQLLEAANSRMCTLALVTLQGRPTGFSGTVILAGHPPALLLRPDGSIRRLGAPCPPLGVFPTVEPQPEEFELGPGDTLLLYTDGFSTREIPTPEMMESLLRGAVGATPRDLIRTIMTGFDEVTDSVFDDRALLVAQVAS